MNKKRHKILNYVLILLLVMVPFRSVIASQKQTCHSPEEMALHSKHATMMMQAALSSNEMKLHEHHRSMMTTDISKDADMAQVKQCCCDSNSNCASSCDIGTMVSLVLQQSLYSPVFTDANGTIAVSPSTILRELTPPSRPPAKLS